MQLYRIDNVRNYRNYADNIKNYSKWIKKCPIKMLFSK